jgi:heterodisulfide reductase subunit A
MMDVGRHPRIKLLAYSEVEEVSGFVGNFRVKIRRKARYVDEKECNACGECAKVCPVVAPDEFQMGLSSRKAVYMPFPQAVPSSYMINMKDCLGNNPIACGKCAVVCEKKAIDYDMQDQMVEIDVGAIIVATGMDVYDPVPLDEYGYTRFSNVLTSMEFERLIGPTGPTEGHLVRPSDRKVPASVGFVQCVGSRSLQRGNPYCSNICCMNTVKETLLLKEHYPTTEAKVFYNEVRAFGKGFEDLVRRSREGGSQYIRGIPGQIDEDPATKDLIITVEDTTTGRIVDHRLDMVVLALGVTPRGDSEGIQRLLALSRTSDGFFMESHPKLKPVDAPTAGVFFAGCAESPKDVKDSVTQGSAAADRAMLLLGSGKINIEAITSVVKEEVCNACGRCIRTCAYGAISGDPKKKIKAVVAEAMCHGCGACAAECPKDCITMKHFTDPQILAMVDMMLEERPQEKIVVFACNWCSYAGADLAGLSRYQYPESGRIIRTMCSARVDEDFVWRAFRKGAPIVLVSGCHFADCKYMNANRWTQIRVERLWDRMEKLGIRPERLQLEWVAASEGARFSQVMKELEEMRRQVTPEEIEETKRVLSAEKTEVSV